MPILLSEVIVLYIIAFLVAIITTLLSLLFLRKLNIVRKKRDAKTLYGKKAKVFISLKGEKELQIPRMGGIGIMVAFLLVFFPFFLQNPNSILSIIYLLTAGAFLIGILDDLKEFLPPHYKFYSLNERIFIAAIFGLVVGVILYLLGFTSVFIFTEIFLGTLIVIFAVLWCVGWFSTGIIDGIDGLAAGLYMIFFFFLSLFFWNNFYLDLQIFLMVLIITIVPFWFLNYKPAKIYLTESGSFPLSMLIATITLFGATQNLNVIPFAILAGLPLFSAPISNILQLIYRQKYHKKLFKIAPVHHHFEAMGIKSERVVLFYYLFACICGFLALILFV